MTRTILRTTLLTTTLLHGALLAGPQEAEAALAPADAAVKLREAMKEGPGPALATIKKFGAVADKEITGALAMGLKHADHTVQVAVVQALRYNTDESAFTELFRVRGNKAIMGHPEVASQYYLALGQHRDKRALPFLLKDLRSNGRQDKVIGSRLLALGRMRDRASVDAIIKFMRANRGGSKEAVTALIVLTGRTEGAKWVSWARWWKENSKSFKISKDEPKLDKREEKTWAKVWAIPGSEATKETRATKKAAPEPETGAGDRSRDSAGEGKAKGEARK